MRRPEFDHLVERVRAAWPRASHWRDDDLEGTYRMLQHFPIELAMEGLEELISSGRQSDPVPAKLRARIEEAAGRRQRTRPTSSPCAGDRHVWATPPRALTVHQGQGYVGTRLVKVGPEEVIQVCARCLAERKVRTTDPDREDTLL